MLSSLDKEEEGGENSKGGKRPSKGMGNENGFSDWEAYRSGERA